MSRLLAEHLEKVDPARDGWTSESFNQAAGEQLRRLADAITGADAKARTDLVAALLADEFSLRPSGELTTELENALWKVSRWRRDEKSPATVRTGAAGLVEALGALGASRFHFKITRVEESGASVATKVLVETSGAGKDLRLQHTGVWTCRWKQLEPGAPPVLMSIDVQELEQVRFASPSARPLLADGTAALLGAALGPELREQLARGQPYWVRRLSRRLGLDVTGHSGLAIGDANGDGLDDVYLCQPGGLPNRLFIHQADGTVREGAKEAGVDWLDPTRSALFVDLEGDGDQDLVVGLYAKLLFLRNDGRGRFQSVAAVPTHRTFSIIAADYDNDRLVDIYVTCYPDRSPVPYHDAANGIGNHLVRNLGDWRFRDVTREVGLDINNRRFSLAAGWEDFDDDGDLDLYVANDFGRNNLYRNDDGHFTDVAAEARVEDQAAGMGVAWADFNRDGRSDLYVSNMFSSAGNRIAYHRRFADAPAGAARAARAAAQRHARGNSLFAADGAGGFTDVSVEAGVAMGRWSWDAKFADLDNDGWEDLIVANGYLTGEKPDDL